MDYDDGRHDDGAGSRQEAGTGPHFKFAFEGGLTKAEKDACKKIVVLLTLAGEGISEEEVVEEMGAGDNHRIVMGLVAISTWLAGMLEVTTGMEFSEFLQCFAIGAEMVEEKVD